MSEPKRERSNDDLEDLENEFDLWFFGRPLTPIIHPPDSPQLTIPKRRKFVRPRECIKIPIDTQINTLSDLIDLAEIYDPKYDYDCVINIKTLHGMLEPLKKLNALIGMDKFKNSLIDQIIFQLTSLRDKDRNKGEPQMLHTVLFGPPGVGKTTLARIFGELYSKMGILSKGHFTMVKRTDLVGPYLGHTAIKTLDVLEKAKGGVLLIDEVYSLGHPREDSDSFSKECIDTLNQFLSENANDFICIIAGYKEQVEKSFFSRNPGLERRFPYKYTIEGYKPSDLLQIFEKFVNESEGWSFSEPKSETIDLSFFQNNKDAFPCYGGDLKVFFDNCKIAHARRTFIMPPENWKKLTKEDIEKGFETYKANKEIKDDSQFLESVSHMWM